MSYVILFAQGQYIVCGTVSHEVLYESGNSRFRQVGNFEKHVTSPFGRLHSLSSITRQTNSELFEERNRVRNWHFEIKKNFVLLTTCGLKVP